MQKCENANLRCKCGSAKKRSIDAMRCDHFEEFSECDANAKIDSHYQPWPRVIKFCTDLNYTQAFRSSLFVIVT
jgi:hypothetical protein